MQTKITIRNEAQSCYIDIEGTIGVPEEHQFEDAASRVATFESFRREVNRIADVAAKSVVVNIRSTGGDVNDALLIYDALRALDAEITTRCYGYTASAATIIAQAADEGLREISSNALYLIHNATCSIDGNASSLDSRAELLRKTDEQLSRLYALHSGRDAEYFAALMAENNGEGRWLTAQEAIEAGLADKFIDFEEEAEVPENPEEQGAKLPEKGESQKAMPADKAKAKSAKGKTMKKKSASKQGVAESIWGSILGYLLNRLAVRLDEWIDSLREKRNVESSDGGKQEDKGNTSRGSRGRKQKGVVAPSEVGESTSTESGGEGSCEPAAEVMTDDGATATMPKASAIPSAVHFSERQRGFVASRLKSVEDPSVGGATSYSNEQAYSEDIKAFER